MAEYKIPLFLNQDSRYNATRLAYARDRYEQAGSASAKLDAYLRVEADGAYWFTQRYMLFAP